MEIVYKCVLLKDDNEFYSYSAEGKACVNYKLNEWAYPPNWLKEKGFGLLCFKSLESAKMFIENEYPTAIKYRSVILKCIGENKINLPPFCSIVKLSEGVILNSELSDFFYGSVSFEKIKPIMIEWYIDRNYFNDFLSIKLEKENLKNFISIEL